MGINLKNEKNNEYNDTFHALCPYFAMFPPSFAHEMIEKYSREGDLVVDPFSGRGTTLLEARLMKRYAIANDINPVAVTITKAKSQCINLDSCLTKIINLRKKYNNSNLQTLQKEASELPIFFRHAYHAKTLLQVLWLKQELRRVKNPELIFIKTLCLSYLHGETNKTKLTYFSNNLPHTYCPKPDYSIRFWEERNMRAPEVDAFDILLDRSLFRLMNSKQSYAIYDGQCILGDVRKIDKNIKKITQQKAKLIVTSPPYIKITSYESDQWLRLWFLGFPPYPNWGKITKDDVITSQEKYIDFLADSWKAIRNIMTNDGVIVCRIGQSSRDNFPLDYFMLESIKRSGNGFKIIDTNFSPFKKTRQAIMFGSKNINKSGEFDFTLSVC